MSCIYLHYNKIYIYIYVNNLISDTIKLLPTFIGLLTFTYYTLAPDDPTGLREITEQASTTSVYIEWDESPPTTCDGVTWYELSYTMDTSRFFYMVR